MKVKFNVIGMTCASCVARVSEALKSIPEIDDVLVGLSPAVAFIDFNSPASLPYLNMMIQEKIGNHYSLTIFDEDAPIIESKVEEKSTSKASTYFPLLLILFYILAFTFWRRWEGMSLTPTLEHVFHEAMYDFMGAFFVVFSFFKLLNLKGFATAYQTYDIIAKKSNLYGLIYPFIELGLGVGYLLRWNLLSINSITLVLMVIGLIGVINSLRQKRTIQCACLGTVFNLPMSYVTVIEDGLMAIMAGMSLLMG